MVIKKNRIWKSVQTELEMTPSISLWPSLPLCVEQKWLVDPTYPIRPAICQITNLFIYPYTLSIHYVLIYLSIQPSICLFATVFFPWMSWGMNWWSDGLMVTNIYDFPFLSLVLPVAPSICSPGLNILLSCRCNLSDHSFSFPSMCVCVCGRRGSGEGSVVSQIRGGRREVSEKREFVNFSSYDSSPENRSNMQRNATGAQRMRKQNLSKRRRGEVHTGWLLLIAAVVRRMLTRVTNRLLR